MRNMLHPHCEAHWSGVEHFTPAIAKGSPERIATMANCGSFTMVHKACTDIRAMREELERNAYKCCLSDQQH